ncbi:hypothetical protein GUITHDRAFT_141404 [Guillardia theta CCMP2712]|uniref:Cyclic nucleotide-binding domain-containing protein n=1 Tax=Guillardia theta (strain CCMP2712) TaxID=905079 RepID=L1J101_GUITC|nr:hypothetical protein GUITHDRAFT_141404 [Guillardia theta CCMP2712]EKX42201.1 hypothetical protein GUITHDRAFT_141404 [Guillardia theta CCMP2712]|eukprot:XP_005829181.1 hypothetical protein GUITHDRAFT_141404 [Guillardia theta CCMP2712]
MQKTSTSSGCEECPWVTSHTYKCQILCVIPFLGNLVSDFREDLLSALSTRMSVIPFRRSELLAQDEEGRDSLFIVSHGEVIAHIEKRTYKFGPGDYFGDWNFFHVQAHKHSKYLALTDGICLSLSKASFDEVLTAFPPEVAEHLSIFSEYFHGFDLNEEFQAERPAQVAGQVSREAAGIQRELEAQGGRVTHIYDILDDCRNSKAPRSALAGFQSGGR